MLTTATSWRQRHGGECRQRGRAGGRAISITGAAEVASPDSVGVHPSAVSVTVVSEHPNRERARPRGRGMVGGEPHIVAVSLLLADMIANYQQTLHSATRRYIVMYTHTALQDIYYSTHVQVTGS